MTKAYNYRDAYNTTLWHDENLCDFETVINATNIRNELFFANYDKAPWHVQAEINGITLNFYPHKMKAYSDEFGLKEDIHEIIEMIHNAKDLEEEEVLE